MSEPSELRPDREAARVLEELERIAAVRRARSTSQQLAAGPRHSGRLLGALLVTRGFLMPDELGSALAIQQQTGERLGEILVRLGLIEKGDLAELLAEQLRLDTVRLERVTIDPEIAGLLPRGEIRALAALPFRRRDAHIDIAIADPTDQVTIALLAQALGMPVRLYVTTRADIEAAVDRLPDRRTRV